MRVFISIFVVLSMLTHALPVFGQAPVEESEPNDTPATADTAVLGGKVRGDVGCSICDNDPFDYWVVFANAGDTIHVDVDSCPGCVDAHTGVTLLAADGATILAEGRSWDESDEQLEYVVTITGPYFIRVGGSHYGSPPYTLTFAPPPPCPGGASEPNNTLATATRIEPGAVVQAAWCPNGDNDFYAVQLQAGASIEYAIDEYRVGGYYGGPGVEILNADGQAVDFIRETEIGPATFTATTAGTYYIHPWTSRGGLNRPYRLRVLPAGTLRPGPGDPPIVRFSGTDVYPAPLVVDRHGNFWGPGNNAGASIVRVSLDSTVTKYDAPDLGNVAAAFDPWDNLLTIHSQAVVKFAPPDRTERLITFGSEGWSGLAVTKDAIWTSNAWTGPTFLRKYSLQGELLESYTLPDVRAFSLVIGPSGDPYFSWMNTIYRFVAGHAEVVLKHEHPSDISGFAFDNQGKLYVTDRGISWVDDQRLAGRVSLHDPQGAVVADSFAWWPHAPSLPVFGRDSTGTTNRRLFIINNGNASGAGYTVLTELNSAGVRAPGLPVQPVAECPMDASEGEPNDITASARRIVPDTTQTGFSCMAGDEDLFTFTARDSRPLKFEVHGADLPTLELLAADGRTRLAFSDGALVPNPQFSYRVMAEQAYYVRVKSWFGGPKPYTLTIGSTLSRPDGLTLERAARELVHPLSILNVAQRTYLDVLGNNDGRYDVGDFRAFLRRESSAPGGSK